MTRPLFFYAMFVLLLAGCGKSKKEPYEYPKTMASGFELLQQETLSPSAAPDSIRSLAIKDIWRGQYRSATGAVSVTVYETAAGAVAFEAMQKWRHGKGQITFHQGIDFVVIESADLDIAALEGLSNAIGTSLHGRGK